MIRKQAAISIPFYANPHDNRCIRFLDTQTAGISISCPTRAVYHIINVRWNYIYEIQYIGNDVPGNRLPASIEFLA